MKETVLRTEWSYCFTGCCKVHKTGPGVCFVWRGQGEVYLRARFLLEHILQHNMEALMAIRLSYFGTRRKCQSFGSCEAQKWEGRVCWGGSEEAVLYVEMSVEDEWSWHRMMRW